MLDGIGDGVRDVGVGRRFPFLVAARRLVSFVGRHVDAERLDELVVDAPSAAMVRSDEIDDGLLVARPNREEAIFAIQVPAADVVELVAREPVTSGLATDVLQLTDRPQRRRPSATAEVSHLSVGDGRQRDFDRGFFSRRRRSVISLRRSSPSGTTRPAR